MFFYLWTSTKEKRTDIERTFSGNEQGRKPGECVLTWWWNVVWNENENENEKQEKDDDDAMHARKQQWTNRERERERKKILNNSMKSLGWEQSNIYAYMRIQMLHWSLIILVLDKPHLIGDLGIQNHQLCFDIFDGDLLLIVHEVIRFTKGSWSNPILSIRSKWWHDGSYHSSRLSSKSNVREA